MNNRFIKLFTAIAFIAVFILQGIWLYNMYSLLEKDMEDKLVGIFSHSIEKEIYLRQNKHKKEISGTAVKGAHPELDTYTNALYFQEHLTSFGFMFDFESLDSIFNKDLKDNVAELNYSLELLDNEGNIVKEITHNLSSPFFIKEMPIKIDKSESVRVSIESPYKIIFQQMFMLLIASLVFALIIIYCIYLQIKIITRQDRIAEIRQDFTHAMVHDMKNPITTILMGINALKGGKLDDKAELKKQYYDIVSKEGEHLLALTNKILIIARFEEKRINLSKEDVNLVKLFDNLIEKYKLNSQKDIQIITEFNNIEAIYVDPEYIYEAFNNLIDNAVKYSKDHVTISIICDKDAFNTTIKIKDNGIGISLNDQKRIFEKFERVYSCSNKLVSGFGLGLNYVYQVVMAHEGDIKINSVLGLYSEFIVIIPNKKDDKTIIDRR
ncbi:MAG: HAMP domain-containing sensor histidine kinase [Dysgonomonas sp.]|nr:HAMP domain-containing sensor histidine kinase [Dysgonomonas sp.]